MIRILRYPSRVAERRLAVIAGRSLAFRPKEMQVVTRILAEVRRKGDQALVAYGRRFDAPGLTCESLKASPVEIAAAHKVVKKSFMASLERVMANIEGFHRRQTRQSWISTERPGTLLGQLVHPVGSAGLYVPGGKGGATPLVSSVLMNAIPARIAGVETISMITPPRPDGSVDPHLLVAAQRAGVSGVYKAGSAWGVAALAYGTATIPRADVIVGPGNLWVTLAKKLLAGTVGIDMLAGPSEILVIADRSANPVWAAADLLSQAEHDPLASAILLTDDASLAREVAAALAIQLDGLARREIAAASLRRFGAILVVPDLDAAMELAGRIAPEHLELLLSSPFDWLGRVRNAGAIFLGHHTPEAVGDYIAGPNHVLPTAGTARFSSALSVDHFIRKSSVIYYSQEALAREAADINCLAGIEGLGAHANAVAVRLGKGKQSGIRKVSREVTSHPGQRR